MDLIGEFASGHRRLPGVEKANRRWAESCSRSPFLSFYLLQLPVSDAVWKHTPHMRFLQFPWRWLMALSVVVCVLRHGVAQISSRPMAGDRGRQC